MSHPGVHIGLRTLDVVMEVVTERLDVGNGVGGGGRVREMTRGENKCNIASIVRVPQPLQVTDFERRFAVGVKNLGSSLDGRLTSGIDKFLTLVLRMIPNRQ